MTRGSIALGLISPLFLLLACGGGKGSESQPLALLLGLSGTPPWDTSPGSGAGVSPPEAGAGSTATTARTYPDDVAAALGVETHGFLGCGQLPYGVMDPNRVGACVQAPPHSGVDFFPTRLGQVLAPSGPPGSGYCHPGKQYRLFTAPSVVVTWALSACFSGTASHPNPFPSPVPPSSGSGGGGTPSPVPAPNPAPAPTPTPTPGGGDPVEPQPLEVLNFGFSKDRNGFVLTEWRLISVAFNRPIALEAATKDSSMQLWKRTANGNWVRVPDTGVECFSRHPSILRGVVHFSSKSCHVPFRVELNEANYEPETTYRLLLSADIRTQDGAKLGVSNSLGDITGQPEQWSGVEFRTAKISCYETFADYTVQGELYMYCAYETPAGSSAPDFGCAYHGGPNPFMSEHPPCTRATFPGIPAEASVFSTVGNDACRSLTPFVTGSGETRREHNEKSLCIRNPGKPDEYIRGYFEGAASKVEQCDGVVRPITGALSDWGHGPDSYDYTVFRRAACDGIPERETAKPCGARVAIDASRGQWFAGESGALEVPGLHTFWENQPLSVKITGVCESGFHRLAISAQNTKGPKPAWYDSFLFNAAWADHVAGLRVRAEDGRSHRDGTLIWLEKGDTDLELTWSNDAYKKGEYDANVQITSISVSPTHRTPSPSLRRAGAAFCRLEGRFYADRNSIYADRSGQKAIYCFDTTPGRHRIEVTLLDTDQAAAGLSSLRVEVTVDGAPVGEMLFPVKAGRVSRTLETDVFSKDARVALRWIDTPPAGEKVRFQIKRIQLERLGENAGSALAGYLGSPAGRRSLALGLAIFFVIVLILGLRWRSAQRSRAGRSS